VNHSVWEGASRGCLQRARLAFADRGSCISSLVPDLSLSFLSSSSRLSKHTAPFPHHPPPFTANMPSGKSESGEAPGSESRRSSLRRLSSIASFQALNPFSRRRSNATSDSTATSSTLSLASTANTNANTNNANQLTTSSSQMFPSYDIDEMSDVPMPPMPNYTTTAVTGAGQGGSSRRSSYICLPDDPIGGMPRSRTFSNLPLPTRARRNQGMVC
jgi:hypothetical protein